MREQRSLQEMVAVEIWLKMGAPALETCHKPSDVLMRRFVIKPTEGARCHKPSDVLTRRFVIKPTGGARTTTAHPTGDGDSRDMVENGGPCP